MQTYPLLASLTGAALLALLVAERLDSSPGRWLTKPLASAGFLAAALCGGWPGTGFGLAILAALVLCLAGDLLLIPKATGWFAAGLGAFLAGHLGFAAAFVLLGVSLAWLPGALVAVTCLALLVHRWLEPHVPGRLKLPVKAYIVVISIMVVLAVGSFGHRGDARAGVLLAGAGAFFVSDLAVARNRFVSPGFVNRLWGLPLYYGAQLLFAWVVATGH